MPIPRRTFLRQLRQLAAERDCHDGETQTIGTFPRSDLSRCDDCTLIRGFYSSHPVPNVAKGGNPISDVRLPSSRFAGLALGWLFVTWYGLIGGHKSTKSLSGKRLN